MRIDRSKLKKSSSDIPSDCRQLIDRLKGCSEPELLSELRLIKSWNYGKSELFHWIDVLDLFDSILEKGVRKDRDGQWALPCDDPSASLSSSLTTTNASTTNPSLVASASAAGATGHQLKDLLIHVISFTSLLIEHSFSRHLYNSMEHLTTLLSSSDMQIVLSVLNLLYVFSKRSNFISRLNSDRRQALILRLNFLAESWGGKENGFGLAECCQDLPMSAFPSSATNLHFEFYSDEATSATNVSSLPGSSSSSYAASGPSVMSSPSPIAASTGTPISSSLKSSGSKGQSGASSAATTLITIHVDSVDGIRDKSLAAIMEELVETYTVPKNKQMLLFTHLRLAHSFSNYRKRLQCVQARLQALSIIVYCNAMSVQDNSNNILYNGFIEELVDVLELKNNKLLDIKAAALRTLTSVIHLDHSSKLTTIIDVTGANSYHGFLPSLVRSCIQALIDGDTDAFPLPFATALFSFLYHLASYENGGEALVSCGMIESLLKVIGWKGSDPEHITFVTRAVRVIDLITNLDMSAFQTHTGLSIFINRLESEVEICKLEQPFVIGVPESSSRLDQDSILSLTDGHEEDESLAAGASDASALRDQTSSSLEKSVPMEVDSSPKPSAVLNQSSAGPSGTSTSTTTPNSGSKDLQCYAQRAALLKSMLNFLKKAIQDSAFSDSIRHLMDGPLPSSLRHIISNAEYYGPSLFMLATDVVTVYVFQEPSLLSTLQESGLTDVVLQALLSKDVPATREVIASLPNVFSALCLNSRGLAAFAACKPFDKVFRVLLSNEYLPAMRRRRSSDPMGDTASNLGNSMDELMRHQPSLRADATAAIISLLHELCALGSNPNFICSKSSSISSKGLDGSGGAGVDGGVGGSRHHHHQVLQPGNDAGSSDEDDDEEEDATNPGTDSSSQMIVKSQSGSGSKSAASADEKQPVPLVDFILNVMRFLDAILSNNSTDDHCKEFVKQKGLTPLLNILMLPNLPIDFPLHQACVSVASVSKSILTLAHEKNVLREGLTHLMSVMGRLEGLHAHPEPPGGSVLLDELLDATSRSQAIGPNCDPLQSASLTPLLHAMSAAHSLIILFVHVCRTGQADVRSLSVSHWGSELGVAVLRKLSELYTSLVWESTVLLALCSESTANANWQFARHQLEKLTALTKDSLNVSSPAPVASSATTSSNAATVTDESTPAMEVDEPETLRGALASASSSQTSSSSSAVAVLKKGKVQNKLSPQVRQIKLLLSSASRLGRVLAELFGLLVKLSVGSPLRHRRSHHPMPNTLMAPTPAARAVSESLTKLLARGLSWVPPPTSPIPKFRLTFYICSVGFTSPMLFDERKFPYHLMLQQFERHGGQSAFFETFNWALSQGGKVPLEEGIEHPDLPEGTGEFLDSWLMLLEKMINPKHVLESPHSLPKTPSSSSNAAANQPFDPIKYLIHIHKKAFECVMYLWNKKPIKTYGERMSETVLSILCHLLKGETIISERLAKEKETSDAAAAAAAATGNTVASGGTGTAGSSAGRSALSSHRNELEEQGINTEHLQQLQDMGFAREHALDALMQTASLEQATDYLLSHPMPARIGASGAVGAGIPDDDEDAMQAAISLSLGEETVPSSSSTAPPAGEVVEDPLKDEPLSKEQMDEFTCDILPGCLRLLDTLPETVYRVCDLLIAVSARNGDKWIADIFNHLISEISSNVNKLIKSTEPMTQGDKRSLPEWANQVTNMPEATKAATRIHVFSLLFEEKRNECAHLIQETDLIESLVQLLEATQNTMAIANSASIASGSTTHMATPKWLAPVILLIDLFDKAAVASVRRAPLLYYSRRQWKWFDDRSGKWSAYIAQNNRSIDDAYKNGEPFVRFTAGTRRKYTVQFSTMVQVNEDSGSWRPIMFVNDDRAMDVSEEGSSVAAAKFAANNFKTVNGLEVNQCSALIRAAVGFISVPVEPDTLHAVMRLVLRLTRTYEQAAMFAELGGIRAILSLTQRSAFTGFNSLATLIVRHVLEEPVTLKATMEKVIRSTVHHSPSSFKEMHYMLRVLGPAACRDRQLFCEVVKASLRVNLPPLTKREDEDVRMTGPNAVQILKLANPSKSTPTTAASTPSKIIRDLVCDLLNSLAVKSVAMTPVDENKELLTPAGASAGAPTAAGPSGAPVVLPEAVDVDEDSETAIDLLPIDFKLPSKDEEAKRNRPLLTQSSLLRLLAELARSYPVVAKIVTDFSYSAGQSEVIQEDSSALAFILDNLLPSCQSQGDKDCSALSRVLIAAISSCNHCPEAQSQLVSEVKAALFRSVQLQESADKHSRIQAITNVMNTMIESCPSVSPPAGQANMPSNVRNQASGSLNNIVKIMLRKGLVNDLARVTHSLDLSSPHMGMTVNSVLKPLETLSRIVNQPTLPVPQVKKAKTSQSNMSSTASGLMPEAMDVGSSGAAVTQDEASAAAVAADAIVGDDGDEQSDQQAVTGNDDTIADGGGGGGNSATTVSEANAFADLAVDDNTDNALDSTFELSRAVILDEELRNDSMVDELSHVTESHDNIVNANGAESESNDDSASEDEDEDDDEDEDEDDEEDNDDDSAAEDHEDDDDDRDDEEEDDEDVDDDEEGSGLMDEEGMETESGLMRLGDRVDEESFLLDFDDIISPSAIREGIAGLIPGLLEADAHVPSSDNTLPSVPPAPGNVSISHPLLVRHSDLTSGFSSAPGNVTGAAASILAARHNRLPRSRFRYAGGGAGGSRDPGIAGGFGALSHNWAHLTGAGTAGLPSGAGVVAGGGLGSGSRHHHHHSHSGHGGGGGSGHSNNPPMILQRLLGNDFQIIATDELTELVEYPDGPYISGTGASNSSTLGAIPSAMVRWTEESRVLDGDSMHDCVTSLKPDVITFLESCRDQEISERKEKRKRLIEEEDKKNREKAEKLAAAQAAAAAASSSNNETESKVDNESAVNSSTQQLAENIVQGVLAPVLNSSTGNSGLSATAGAIGPYVPVRSRQTARRGRLRPPGDRVMPPVPQPQSASLAVNNDSAPDDASVDENPADDSPTSPSADPVVPMELPSSSLSAEMQTDNEVTEMIVQESTAGDAMQQNQDDESGSERRNNEMDTVSVSDDMTGNMLNSLFEPIFTSTPSEGSDTHIIPGAEGAAAGSASAAAVGVSGGASAPEPNNTVEVMNSSGSEVEVVGPAVPTSTPAELSAPPSAPSASSEPEIPEGVDPSFLAALPESIRQEVIAEQLRLQRQRTAAAAAAAGNQPQQSSSGQASGGAVASSSSTDPTSAAAAALASADISPEFLAALPPSIQEEVLAEQRLQRAASNIDPDAPHQFIQTLPPLLRRQVLADMDDSQIAVLPEQLATEAQALRNELEQRQRQVQERFFTTHAGSTLSRILRSAGTLSHGSIHRMHATLFADSASGGRIGGGTRYAIQTMQGSSHWPWSVSGSRGAGAGNMQNSGSNYRPGLSKFKGRQLLDHEALSCLLILLFVDEPKLNIGRLHRVLRNLSQHPTTRQWVIQSLLTIMERTRENRELETTRSRKGPSTPGQKMSGHQVASWLSISLDAALGCKTNVFQVQRMSSSKKQPLSVASAGQGVTIHPQAAPLVSRHVLDALISLAKSFPHQFLNDASAGVPEAKSVPAVAVSNTNSQTPGSKDGQSGDLLAAKVLNKDADFWDVLIKLDSLSTSKKGKSVLHKSHNISSSSVAAGTPGAAGTSAGTESDSEVSDNGSHLRAVIGLLSHPVIRRSAPLTDRLLRLLSLIALALPAYEQQQSQAVKDEGAKSAEEQVRPLVREEQLRLAVEVLTSKSCSEEGLEDVNSLLLRLSKSCPKTRDIVLELLLAGAQTLGQTVRANIDSLHEELQYLSTRKGQPVAGAEAVAGPSNAQKSGGDEDGSQSDESLAKGVVQDRFTRQKVVITAPSSFKPSMSSKEVQLPSMATLTSKTSSQSFFLRILKVIIQLRDSIRNQEVKKASNRASAAAATSAGSANRSAEDRAVIEAARAADPDARDLNEQDLADLALLRAAGTDIVNVRESNAAPAAASDNVPATSSSHSEERSVTSPQQSMEVDLASNESTSTAPVASSSLATTAVAVKIEAISQEPEVSATGPKDELLSNLLSLEDLWDSLSHCLLELADAPDHHAVLVLQPAVEAFFLVHASEKDLSSRSRSDPRHESRENQLAHINAEFAAPASPSANDQSDGLSGGSSDRKDAHLPPDTQKFLKFAETHKFVLNQILRQSTTPLVDGPFAVLVDHTRVLDFDVKRRYFRQELERLDDGVRREDLAVHVRRENVFEDSFRELYRRSPDEWKNRFYIVFEGEEGQDAGGLLREWYTIISREIFNPMYALFCTSPGDRVTYMINSASHCNSNHLQYFKFVGRVIAKAIYDNKLLECYFTRSFYKHILGKSVKYQDMESEDYAFYQGLVFLLEHEIRELGYDLTFSIEIQEFGVTEVRDLKPGGRNIPVTEAMKQEYVRLVCQEKMTGAIRKQLNAFLEGFYEIIPKRLISIFNEQETELLISGLPNIDIDDLKGNTEYHKYQSTSLQIQWFWRALRSFDQADRAKFLQFVTGTSKVPLQGFASLEGMNGTQKFQIHRDDRSTDRLPSAHTCFNQLDLPAYETYDKLKTMLLLAVRECSEGFGFA